MTIIRASDAPVNLKKGKPNYTSPTVSSPVWTKPADWITFTTPSASEQKVIGTVAVFNFDSNYIAFNISTTDASTYTVDWGDGTSNVVASGVQANKNYTWSSISAGTLTSEGYRQAVITITPTNSGATFSSILFNCKNPGVVNPATNYSNPWLNLAVAAPNATGIQFGTTPAGVATTIMNMVQQINIVSCNITSADFLFKSMANLKSVLIGQTGILTSVNAMFNYCYRLQSVTLFNTANVTNMANMFVNCTSLTSVPLFNTSSVTNMNLMFQNCNALTTVPLFDTAIVTNMSAMFSGCYSLTSVPLFNTANVTNMGSMFLQCYSLPTVPFFNTASAVTMASMFSGCSSLQSVPLFNTANVTIMSSMFQSCSKLTSVPFFNTASAVTMASMFSFCTSLTSVPLFNTANVTNMSAMFQQNYALTTVPLFNTVNVTTMASMFSFCTSLTSVPLFNTANVTLMNSMFGSCTSLKSIPAFNTSKVTNFTTFLSNTGDSLQTISELNLSAVTSVAFNNLALSGAGNLAQAKLTGNRWTQSFLNCKMGATQLNEMYSSLATLMPSVTGASGTGSVVTYTVSDIRAFVTSRTVSVVGVNPTAYNLSGTITSVTPTTGTAGTFTIGGGATGTYLGGGTATLNDNKTITVTSNPGTATDTPSIATNKGWTVTG